MLSAFFLHHICSLQVTALSISLWRRSSASFVNKNMFPSLYNEPQVTFFGLAIGGLLYNIFRAKPGLFLFIFVLFKHRFLQKKL